MVYATTWQASMLSHKASLGRALPSLITGPRSWHHGETVAAPELVNKTALMRRAARKAAVKNCMSTGGHHCSLSLPFCFCIFPAGTGRPSWRLRVRSQDRGRQHLLGRQALLTHRPLQRTLNRGRLVSEPSSEQNHPQSFFYFFYYSFYRLVPT